MRPHFKLWLFAPLLCWPMVVCADEDPVAKLISDCGAADLSQESLDSCLERVRVLEETDPSPQLQTLEATLEQRESGRPVRTPAPRVVEVAPEANTTAQEESERDQSVQAAQPDSSVPRSGAALEDEPPVSDPPDTPAGTDSSRNNDADDPPQS
jgi:hypothetical protein